MARNFWDEAEKAASLQGNPGAFQRGANSFGRGAADFGKYAIEALASNWSEPYAQRMMLQQQLEADQKRAGLNRDYMTQLLGQQGNNPQNIDIGSYDPITQELMGEEGIQQGSGYFGGAQSSMDQLKLMAGMTSAPSKITQTAGAGMMRDLMGEETRDRLNPAGDRFADKWLNLGNEYMNPVTGESYPIRENPNYKTVDQGLYHTRLQTGEQFGKNVADTSTQKGVGTYRAKRLGDFTKSVAAGEAGLGAINDTILKLGELSGATDYTTTGLASWLNRAPMLPPNEWMHMRDVIVSRLATDKMAELKALSPNGSTGFGALSQKELEVLQQQLGNLSQERRPDAIKKQITEIVRLLDKSKNTMQRAQDKEIGWYNRNLVDGFDRYERPTAPAKADVPTGIPDEVINGKDYSTYTDAELDALLEGR